MNSALAYAILAMIGGVFYREFTKYLRRSVSEADKYLTSNQNIIQKIRLAPDFFFSQTQNF